MLKNEYLVAKFGFDTAENEPSKIFGPACLPPPTNLITYGIIDGDSTRDEYMLIPFKLLWMNQHPKGVRSGRRRIRRIRVAQNLGVTTPEQNARRDSTHCEL